MYSAVVVQEVLQRRREPQRWGVQWLAIRSWQRQNERIIEGDLLTTTWEIAKECNMDHSKVIWHLKQVGKVKKLDKWVPHELTTNQKRKFILKCCLLSFNATTLNHISIQLWRATKTRFLSNNRQWPAQWLDQNKSLNLYQKNVMVTVWWSAASLIHYSFLNPSASITSEKYAQQTEEMHQKLQRLRPALVN